MIQNLESLLRLRYGEVKRSRGKNGVELRIKCPLPHCDDRKFKMYINPDRECYNCYKCGGSGNVRELVEVQSKVDSYVAPRVVEEIKKNILAPGLMVPLTSLDQDNPAIKYLTQTRKRRFDAAELEQLFGVQYCTTGRIFRLGDGSIFNTSNTIIFPVWMHGAVAGWQSRLLYNPDELSPAECEALGIPKDEDGEYLLPSKYFTSPGMSKGRVLYNFDIAKKCNIVDPQGRRVVVVTEGPFDAISVGACAVACFGKGFTDVQTNLLAMNWDKVYILLDPGDADDQMSELQFKLSRSVDVVRIDLQKYKDAGDTPREEIWRQIMQAESSFQAQMKTMLSVN